MKKKIHQLNCLNFLSRVCMNSDKKISFSCIRLFKPVKGQPKKQSKQKRTDKPIVIEDTRLNGPSLNNITHLGGGGSAKGWRYSISLFSKMGDKGEGRVKILKKWETSFMDGPLKMTCDHKVSALVFWLKKFVIHNAPDFVQNEYIIHNIYSNIFCLFYRNGILICQKKWEVFGAVCDISKFHFCKTNRKYCSTYYYWTNMNL